MLNQIIVIAKYYIMRTTIILLSVVLFSSTLFAKSYTTSYYILTLEDHVATQQVQQFQHNGFDTQVDSTQPNVMYVKANGNNQVPFYLIQNIERIQYVNAQGQVINMKHTATPTQPNFFKIFFSFLI